MLKYLFYFKHLHEHNPQLILIVCQVRWDCPPEYGQYQAAQQQAAPAPAGPARLVSGYDSDTEDEEPEEEAAKPEAAKPEEAKKEEDEESKPDFIGPRIPPKVLHILMNWEQFKTFVGYF